MECLFCRIINGEIPNYTIYEDEMVKVFMDINPITNGHCLIVPKKHIITVNDIDSELAYHILEVEKKIYKLLKDKLKIEGLTIAQNNELGQAVKHFHIHLIPRYINDGWKINYNQENLLTAEEIYKKIVND